MRRINSSASQFLRFQENAYGSVSSHFQTQGLNQTCFSKYTCVPLHTRTLRVNYPLGLSDENDLRTRTGQTSLQTVTWACQLRKHEYPTN